MTLNLDTIGSCFQRFSKLYPSDPGWKVCQLRTECQETDNILRTRNEINVRTKIKIERARDGPIPIFYDSVL